MKSAKSSQQVKKKLHARNKNRERYDIDALVTVNPGLAKFVKPNAFGKRSLDFSNPIVVKLLNRAILSHYYGIANWDFPDDYLCPPIPGRADYIHHIADLLGESNQGNVPTGDKVVCLDIGVGASCIYPIIGIAEYDWNFIGSDIDRKAISSAASIADTNLSLKDKIELRLQRSPQNVFERILGRAECVDAAICNPPFHSSFEEAQKGSQRKVKNLTGKRERTPALNFAGVRTELVCDGGEYGFISNMAKESLGYSKGCLWFSTLVSKRANLKGINGLLREIAANEVKVIPMETGNKSSRIVAWTFLSKGERREWRKTRWGN